MSEDLQLTPELMLNIIETRGEMIDHYRVEVERLKKYESMVHSIATDFIDSSAEFQRNDWHRNCISLVKEDMNVKYDNEDSK